MRFFRFYCAGEVGYLFQVRSLRFIGGVLEVIQVFVARLIWPSVTVILRG